MNLEELVAEGQMRVLGAETVTTAMWMASEFSFPCKERIPVPRWALMLRAMSTRVNMQDDYIAKLEAAND